MLLWAIFNWDLLNVNVANKTDNQFRIVIATKSHFMGWKLNERVLNEWVQSF